MKTDLPTTKFQLLRYFSLRSVITWILLLAGLLLITQLKLNAPLADFIAYWSTGALNLQGQNPYASDLLLSVQRQQGWQLDFALQTWYPPWVMPILMMFGALPYHYSRLLWLLASILILVIVTRQSWKIYQGSENRLWLGLLMGLTFTSSLLVLYLGQITPLVLLGLTGLYAFTKDDSYSTGSGWWIGAAAVLIAIKPQATYLILFALAFWVWEHRCWQVAGGALLALAVALSLALIFNPQLILHYVQAIASSPPNYFATPTLGYLLRWLFGEHLFWLQFIPLLLGMPWLAGYYWRGRQHWVWAERLPIISFASLLTASFAWSHDQILLIPAFIQALLWLSQSRSRSHIFIISGVYLASNLANLILHFRCTEEAFIWNGPLLLVLYLLARRERSQATNVLYPA